MSTTKQIARSKDRKAKDGIKENELFAFLYGERTQKLLQKMYKLAISAEDERVQLEAIKDLLDRYMGKAPQRILQDLTSRGEKIEGIFIGDLKEEEESK